MSIYQNTEIKFCIKFLQLDPVFYGRLSEACTTLVDFFHAGGKGISMETFERMSQYQAILSRFIYSLNRKYN